MTSLLDAVGRSDRLVGRQTLDLITVVGEGGGCAPCEVLCADQRGIHHRLYASVFHLAHILGHIIKTGRVGGGYLEDHVLCALVVVIQLHAKQVEKGSVHTNIKLGHGLPFQIRVGDL